MMNNVKHAQLDIDTTRQQLRETQTSLSEVTKDRDNALIHVRDLQLKVFLY